MAVAIWTHSVTKEWVSRFSLNLVQILWHVTILQIHTSKFPKLAYINVTEAQNGEGGNITKLPPGTHIMNLT